MPITWRNLGQSANTGNSLIAGASDTIAKGINTLQSAAQSVTDEQIRQYDTQADVNTANILTDINRLDQDGIDSFDVDNLSKQFGSQYDATGIADALDARVGSLREAAQQERENQDKATRLGLEADRTASSILTDTAKLDDLTATQKLRKEAKDKQDKFNKFNQGVTANIGAYNNESDLRTKVTKAGQTAGMLPDEIQTAIKAATTTFNDNIAVRPEQRAVLDQRAADQAKLVTRAVTFQNNALDNAARERGIIPELAQLNTTPDSKENNEASIIKAYQSQVSSNNNPFDENSVQAFKSILDNTFSDAGLPNSNAAELNHFISLGFDESGFFDDDGLDFDKVKGKVQQYIKMIQDRDGMQTYNQAKLEIQKSAEATAKRQAEDMKTYAKRVRENNRQGFTGQGQLFDVMPDKVDRSRLGSALLSTNFFNGIDNPPPPPPRKTGRARFRGQR